MAPGGTLPSRGRRRNYNCIPGEDPSGVASVKTLVRVGNRPQEVYLSTMVWDAWLYEKNFFFFNFPNKPNEMYVTKNITTVGAGGNFADIFSN